MASARLGALSRLPCSAFLTLSYGVQIVAVAEVAMKNVHKYKKVVYFIERFIRHTERTYRSAGEG